MNCFFINYGMNFEWFIQYTLHNMSKRKILRIEKYIVTIKRVNCIMKIPKNVSF
jgi:hypothetical protein